jgi:hypothetical protein
MAGPRDGEDEKEHDYSLTGWRLKELERGRTEADKRLDKLESWRNWILGAASIISLTVGVFSKQVWDFVTGR